MNSVSITNVKQTSSTELLFVWSDHLETLVELKLLRDGCPCAGCQGETVVFQTYTPPAPKLDTPGRYQLKGLETVGGYALKFTWGDGHSTGIYTWDHLRFLAEHSGHK